MLRRAYNWGTAWSETRYGGWRCFDGAWLNRLSFRCHHRMCCKLHWALAG